MFTPVQPSNPRQNQKVFKSFPIGEVREVFAKSLSTLKGMIRYRMKMNPGETYSVNEQGPPYQIRRES
jgi:hypothetical protein